MPKIAIYTGRTTVPTNPAFHGTGDGYCTTSTYCEAMFDLTQKEQIPVTQIGQLTSTDLANGVLQSGGYANTSLPSRPALVDQPFDAGHAIMLGFDPWYRAWTTEEERLVLNSLLYPAGTAIPAGQSASEAQGVTAHSRAAARPVPASRLHGE